MKRWLLILSVTLAAALLGGCASGKPEETGGAGEISAAVLDIATTQAFTEEPVSPEDAEQILLAGINAPSAMNGQPWHFTAVTDNAVLRQIAEGMSTGRPGPAPAGDAANAGMPTPPAGDGANAGMPTPPAGDGANAEAPGTPPAGSGANMGTPGMPPAAGGAKAGIADAPLAIVVSCRDGSQLDAGLACQTMSVAAILMGYGTKIITSPTIALNGSNQDYYRELLGIPEDYAAAAVLLIGHTADTTDASTSATARRSMEEVVSWVTP